MQKIPLACAWLAAGESGYAKAADWQDWAIKRVMAEPNPPTWLYELCTTVDREGLWRVLGPVIEQEQQAGAERETIDNAILGYYWLRFERAEFDLNKCLYTAGCHADTYDTSVNDWEFYRLCTGLDDDPESKRLAQRDAEKLFAPFVSTAQEQWRALQEAA